MLGNIARAAGRAAGQRARGRGRGRGRGRAGRGNQGGMSAMGRGRGVRGGPIRGRVIGTGPAKGRGIGTGILAGRPQRAVRGGPRPQRGRARGSNLAPRAAQAASNASIRAQRNPLIPLSAKASNTAGIGAMLPRLFNPSRPVNARLLGGVGPSRAVNPAARLRQLQLQGMGNLQRPRPINPNQSAAQFLGISARPMNPRAAMGSLFGRPAFGRPRGPQMARRVRGRGRGLRGLFG